MLRALSVTKSSQLKINFESHCWIFLDIAHSLTIEKTVLNFKNCDFYLKT